jgi:hypothetical protein
VNRAVLPPLTDTLLVADRFRAAIMALRGDRAGVSVEMRRVVHQSETMIMHRGGRWTRTVMASSTT